MKKVNFNYILFICYQTNEDVGIPNVHMEYVSTMHCRHAMLQDGVVYTENYIMDRTMLV